MGPLFWIILGIIVLSSVVGMIAKALSNFQEQQQQLARPRPPRPMVEEEGTRTTAQKEMERFLAELDRLRRKNQAAREGTGSAAGGTTTAIPVIQPVKKPARPRQIVTEPPAPLPPLPPPPPRPPAVAEMPPAEPFAARPAPPPPPPPPPAAVPYAATPPPSSSEAGPPAAQVARYAPRPRPAAKTPLARNLASLLSTGQGLALAVILQEVLGPPRCRRLHRFPPL